VPQTSVACDETSNASNVRNGSKAATKLEAGKGGKRTLVFRQVPHVAKQHWLVFHSL
jgi:hypothetical protein